ncbi:neprilysin-11-like isoform X2 [Leptotrombidium deliense]|uniref:Neprilysin-11-like isoform X2 n=1 Tax=Leptotrombidium deliense TaxID=299467 RepID=A0A443SUA7_9ACAR|nr:neprilysin-11-like isoform X2 [Leptotrombidium deliense]
MMRIKLKLNFPELQLQAVMKGKAPFREADVCYTDECEQTAKYLHSNLDEKIDPCDDFYAFACNGWIRKNPRPKDEHEWSAVKMLQHQVSEKLIELLEERSYEKLPLSVRKAKSFFAACRQPELRFEYGVQEIKRLFTKLGGFPAITKHWDEDEFDWEASYVYCDTRIGLCQPFFEYEIGDFEVEHGVHKKMIELKSPKLLYLGYTLLDNSKSYREKVDKVMIFTKKMKGRITAIDPNVSPDDLNDEINAVIELDTKIANLSMFADSQSKESDFVNYTIGELTQKFEHIDWYSIFTKIYKEVNIKLLENEVILTKNVHYFQKLGKLLKNTPKRTLANYVNFYFLNEFGARTIFQYHNKNNRTTDSLIRRKCYEVTEDYFKVAINYWFVKTKLTTEATDEVKSFLTELKSALTLTLQNNDWMDDETKMHAQMKLNKMLTFVALPSEIKSDDDLDKIYAETGFISSENYVNAFKKMLKWRKQTELLKLREEWKEDVYSPSDVNAYYTATENKIEILSGFLFPPNYYRKAPLAVNFASIGSTMAHEITHGFDAEGSNYDHKGELKNWWDSKTHQTYEEKVKCFIDQYSDFKHAFINSSINGRRTVSENIADNGALHQSFQAYKMHSAIRNADQDLRLPKKMSKYSKEQLFFIALASTYCSNHSRAFDDDIMKDEHAPDIARVIVPLSNSHEFSKAFRCKVGTKMNPEKKCILW